MTRAGILSAQARAWENMRLCAFAGTYQSREPGASEEVIPVALVLGSTTLESVSGGLTRVRTATVFISKCCHESAPIIKHRVTVCQDGGDPADYRIEDFHDQSPGHWVIRCVQWVK